MPHEWVDSYSDGLCGYVRLRNTETGVEAQVHWSVDRPPLDSQDRAFNEALRRITPRSEGTRHA